MIKLLKNDNRTELGDGPIQYMVHGRSAQMVDELSDGPIQYMVHVRL